MTLDVRIKRIYDPAEPGDGYRVLVDHVGRAASRASARGLTSGRASWPPATSCADGLTTFPSGLRSFALGTRASSAITMS